MGVAPSADSAAGQGHLGWGVHHLLTVQLDKDKGGWVVHPLLTVPVAMWMYGEGNLSHPIKRDEKYFNSCVSHLLTQGKVCPVSGCA